jgi:Fe-S-cluster containining protein
VKSGEKLCLACGLCCDGTLFHYVRLGPSDDAKQLKAIGLPVAPSRSKTPVTRFLQPCAALCADRTCRLYAFRPLQCRIFECGVFRDAQAGRIKFAAARRLVTQARQWADKVRRLLRELGDTEERRALSERFRRTQRRMESGIADAAAGDTFAELGLAVHTLNLLTHEKFYTRNAKTGSGLEFGQARKVARNV